MAESHARLVGVSAEVTYLGSGGRGLEADLERNPNKRAENDFTPGLVLGGWTGGLKPRSGSTINPPSFKPLKLNF